MVVCDPYSRTGFPFTFCYNNVKCNSVIYIFHCDLCILEEVFHLLNLCHGDIRNDFEFFLRTSGNDARGGCRRNPFQMIRVWHNHRFNVLNNTSTCADPHFIRLFPENFPRLRRRIGQCDRLGTSHGRNQFLL